MKIKLLLAGGLIAGTFNLFAQQTEQSILTLQANDTPVVVTGISLADDSTTTTTVTTTKTRSAASVQSSSPGNDTAFIQLSLTPELALEPRTTIIDGLSLNIWGENPQHGVALGIVNGSTGNSSGFTWGIVNYDDTYKGVQWGVVNYSKEYFVGWQRGWVNISLGEFYGLQTSLVNYSEQTTGLQIGAVNYARDLTGVQLGLINIASNNGWFNDFPKKLTPVFPFFNWSF